MYYTIAGIDDIEFPPEHPEVIRYYDRSSAQQMLDLYKRLEPDTFENCWVAEYMVTA